MPRLGPWEIVLLIAGAGLIVAALRTLFFRRDESAAGAEAISARGLRGAERATFGSLSEPTRLSIGVVLLVLGYHLVVWCFPPHQRVLQFPRSRWAFVLIGGVIWIGASLLLDRLQRPTSDQPPHAEDPG